MDIILEVKQISSGHNIYKVSYDEHDLLLLIIIVKTWSLHVIYQEAPESLEGICQIQVHPMKMPLASLTRRSGQIRVS